MLFLQKLKWRAIARNPIRINVFRSTKRITIFGQHSDIRLLRKHINYFVASKDTITIKLDKNNRIKKTQE